MHICIVICIAISFIYFVPFTRGLMLVIGEKFVVAGFWSSHVLSDDRTHVPKSESDVAHLFHLGGNSMELYIIVQVYLGKI